MRRLSHTYRLIAVLTGLLLLVGASFPTGLHAMSTAGEHCPMSESMEDHSDSGMMNHDTSSGQMDCGVGYSCDCCVDEQIIKRAPNSFTRIKAEFSAVVTDIIDDAEPVSMAIRYIRLATETVEASPPIFLINSTFLN